MCIIYTIFVYVCMYICIYIYVYVCIYIYIYNIYAVMQILDSLEIPLN